MSYETGEPVIDDAPRRSVLIVCTGNRCRSPMAEALLRRRFEERGVPLEVGSVGLLEPDLPAPAEVVDVLADFGVDASEHRSRQLATEHIADAAIVLGMERQHVREVFVIDRGAWPRTFTLKELVRRGEAIGPRRADEPLTTWLARAHLGRRPSELLGESPDDDVNDPIGGDPWEYTRAAREIDDLVERLTRLAWPDHSSG